MTKDHLIVMVIAFVGIWGLLKLFDWLVKDTFN